VGVFDYIKKKFGNQAPIKTSLINATIINAIDDCFTEENDFKLRVQLLGFLDTVEVGTYTVPYIFSAKDLKKRTV
jgi:hypothetical protein